MAAPTFQPPPFKQIPIYQAPRWNESEIDRLQQKRAAPGLRAMRSQMNRVGNVSSDNPNVKRMTLRDALAGYGQGLSGVMGQAGATAAGEYSNKYGREVSNAQFGWQGQAQNAMAENAYGMDVAKTRYGSLLEEWRSKENALRAGSTVDQYGRDEHGNMILKGRTTRY